MSYKIKQKIIQKGLANKLIRKINLLFAPIIGIIVLNNRKCLYTLHG